MTQGALTRSRPSSRLACSSETSVPHPVSRLLGLSRFCASSLAPVPFVLSGGVGEASDSPGKEGIGILSGTKCRERRAVPSRLIISQAGSPFCHGDPLGLSGRRALEVGVAGSR